MHQTRSSNGKQPNTPNDDISDSDPSLSFQTQVDDGMYDSQVALRTGQDVKENLSIPGRGPKIVPSPYRHEIMPKETTAANNEPQDTH